MPIKGREWASTERATGDAATVGQTGDWALVELCPGHGRRLKISDTGPVILEYDAHLSKVVAFAKQRANSLVRPIGIYTTDWTGKPLRQVKVIRPDQDIERRHIAEMREQQRRRMRRNSYEIQETDAVGGVAE